MFDMLPKVTPPALIINGRLFNMDQAQSIISSRTTDVQ